MKSKTKNVGEGSKKCRSFRMCLILSDYQFKTSRYNYRSTYMNPMVTTNQKHTIDTQILKESLKKFKRIEIISNFFSDQNSMKLEINYRKKGEKNTNTWRLNNMLLKNQLANEEIKEEIKKYLDANKNGSTTLQNL